MSQYNQENFFIGGMNADDADELMPPTDWRYAMSCLSGNNEKDAVGAIENVQGNTLVSFTLPAGDNRCIGRGSDDLGNIFYMVWNSNQNHCILRYSINTNSIFRVLYPQATPFLVNTKFLNFQNDPRYRIQTIKIITLKRGQQMAYWTDGYDSDIAIPYDTSVSLSLQELKPYTPPRSLNLTLAENLCGGIQPRYPASLGIQNNRYQNQYTDVIKYPPYAGPDVEFLDDDTKNTNYFRGKPLPQFRYRYLFVNGEPSAWSPVSEVALPEEDETILGIATFNYYKNNYVQISYNTGHESAVTVELAVRFGNLGTWYVLDVIQKYDVDQEDNFPLNVLIASDTVRTYDFYNNQRLRAISVSELYNFSNVPIVSKDQEYVETNQIIYANNISGYNPVQMNVVSEPILGRANVGKVTYTGQPQWVIDGFYVISYVVGANTYYDLLFPADHTVIPVDLLLQIKWTSGAVSNGVSYVLTSAILASAASWSAFIDQVQADINALLAPSFAYGSPKILQNNGGYDYYRLVNNSGVGLPIIFSSMEMLATGSIKKVTGFKLGAWHKFAAVYYDDGMRSGAANTEEELNVYVPFLTESSLTIGQPYELADTSSGWAARIDIQINNLAPKWAKSYQITYAGSNISFFVQLPIIGTPVNQTNGKTRINISALLNFFVNDNKPTPINYVYQEGDRIRFITNTDGNVLSSYLDLTISGPIVVAGSVYSIDVDGFDFAGLSIGDGSLIEIYRTRPSTDQNQIVYEFSKERSVLYDQAAGVWYHESDSGFPNQDPNDPINTPATIQMDRGDVYVRRRGYKNAETTAIFSQLGVEDFNFSDFYASENIDIGRTNVIADSFRQKRLETGLTHSDTFFQETDINGLSTFRSEPGSVLLLSLNFGPICRIIEVGYTLKVFQQSKVSSIYIGRLALTKADGTEDLTATDQVFGTKLIPESESGTTWPGSVFKHDRHVYYFDSVKGEIVRDSPNGAYAVSKYKMVKPFRDIGKIVTRYQRTEPTFIDIVSTFDERAGYYIITILKLSEDVTDINSQSIAFHEDSNRWKTQMPYTPEMHGEKGQESVVCFQNGQLWVNYSETAPYNNFFGVQYRQIMRIIHNLDPNKVKVMDRIAIHSTRKWEATDGDGSFNIIVPANAQYPTGMKSRLVAAKFKGKEGAWYSEYLKDANTPGSGTELQKLINGRELRGYVLDITLENGETEYVRLLSVMTCSTPSELSKFANPNPPPIE